jgi:CHAD domain-containing protein
VSILDGNLIKGAFREIEIEAREADARRLQKIADTIERAGAHPEQRSKVSRALQVLHPEALTAQEPARVSPDDPAAMAVGPALARGLAHLLRHDPHARLDEPEGVHGMRVGARRLRSAFRTFEPMLDETRATPAIDELHWLGGMLGEVRDLDVLLIAVSEEAAAHPALKPVKALLEDRTRAARATLREAMDSPRFLALIATMRGLTENESLAKESPGTCAEVMPQLVMTDWRKLRKLARTLTPESGDPDFHRTRILAKRARYAAETVAAFTGRREQRLLRTFAKKLTVVQNVLGEHQDAVVAAEALLELAKEFEGNGALSLELGRFVEREHQRASVKRDEFFKVWRQLDKTKNLQWSRA